MNGSEEGTPRRARVTYGARTKRGRRLLASGKASEEASDLEEAGPKHARQDSDDSSSRRLRSYKRPRHRSESEGRSEPRETLGHGAAPSPNANRFTTPPPPPLSQEIAQAFETASPGTLHEVDDSTIDHQSQNFEELTGRDAGQRPSSFVESSPTDLKRRGVAAKMRAKNLFSRTPSLSGEQIAADEAVSASGGGRGTSPAQRLANGVEMERPIGFDQANISPARRSLVQEATRLRTPPSSPGRARLRDAQMGHSPSKAALTSPSGRSKVTYSSGLRTFLESRPSLAAEEAVPSTSEPIAGSQAAETAQEKQTQRESYSDLRKRWVIEDEAIGSTSSATASTLIPLRSLTALRSDGSQRRFLDSLEYLLAGLDENNSVGARRSSSIEIVKRMCLDTAQDTDREDDSTPSPEASLDDFLLRLRITETQGRLWKALRRAGGGSGTDEILDWALLISLARMTEGSGGATALLQGHLDDVVHSLRSVLASAGYRRRQSGISNRKPKNEKMMLEALRSLSRHVTQVTLPPQDASDADTSLLVLTLGIMISLRDSPSSLLDMLTYKPSIEDDHGTGKVDQSTRKCLLELLLNHLSFEGQIAAARVASFERDVNLASKETKATEMPSLDFLGVAARLLEQCTGPADAQALSGAVQDVCTEEEIRNLVSYFVKVLQVLWFFVSQLKEQKQANIAIAARVTHKAATNVLADWIKLLAAFTQHSQVWCNGLLTEDSGLGAILRIVSTLAQGPILLWQGPSLLHSSSSISLGALSASSALDSGDKGRSTKAGPLGNTVDSKLSAASHITNHDLLCYCLALVDHLVGEGAAAARVAGLQIDPGCRRHECALSGCSPHEGAQSALVLLFKLFLTHYDLSLPRDTITGEPQASTNVVADDVVQSDSALLAGCAAHTIAVCLRSHPQSLELLMSCTSNPAQALGDCLTSFSAVSHAYKSMLNMGPGSSAHDSQFTGLGEDGRTTADVDEDVGNLAQLMLELADGGKAQGGRV